jgi:hypothetical protein
MNKELFVNLYNIFFEKFDNYFLFLEQVIEFYSIYDGYPLDIEIDKKDTIQESIKENILKRYKELSFILDKDLMLNPNEVALLERIAIGDRRAFTAIKKENISQINGSYIFNKLQEIGLLEKELSREKLLTSSKTLPKKKEYRGYQVQHKFKFRSSFLRFWFNFIEPNIKLLEKGEYDKVLEKILKHFESFVSFTFEELSLELIKVEFDNIVEIGSYWDKRIEIDLLCKLSSDISIAGECKWKNHKMSKKIFNSLESKVNISNLYIDKFALFSKRGFSKELQRLNNKNILLYDLKSFKRLVDDK